MNGRIAVMGIVLTGIIAGIAMYYLQVFAFYDETLVEDVEIELTSVVSGESEVILFDDLQAIDGTSSPIRFRACFTTPMSAALLSETYTLYDAAEPLVAPGWFDCFDAAEIGAALEEGQALSFMGVENVTYGVDRVVAILPDGRGFAWHQINRCGEVVFDGNPVPEGCPEPE